MLFQFILLFKNYVTLKLEIAYGVECLQSLWIILIVIDIMQYFTATGLFVRELRIYGGFAEFMSYMN
jgi:hypothetical protein